MPWNKNEEATVFECDDCDAKEPAASSVTDFAVCWRVMQGIGWRSFKRIGQPWTFHCPKCGPQAEVEHREHKRREAERDRLKHRNARD